MSELVQDDVTYPGDKQYLNASDLIQTLLPREREFLIRRLEIKTIINKLKVINRKYKRKIGLCLFPFRFKSKVVKDKHPHLKCGVCKQCTCLLRSIPFVKKEFKCETVSYTASYEIAVPRHNVYSTPCCQQQILCDDCLTLYRECECGKYFICEDETKCPECLNWAIITVNIIETSDFSFNKSHLPPKSIIKYAGIEIVSIQSSKVVFKYHLKDYKYDIDRLQSRNCENIYNILFNIFRKKSILVYMDGYSEYLDQTTEVKFIFTANTEYSLFALPIDHTNNNSQYNNDY